VENNTLNYPELTNPLTAYNDLLILAGSNDILLDRSLNLYNRQSDYLAVFANVGSMGGLHALRRNACHMAASHLQGEQDDEEYNFSMVNRELSNTPVVVNFCKRHQGLIVAKGNPKGIHSIGDLAGETVRIVNRHLGTGTRLLLDNELDQAGIRASQVNGYDQEVNRHLDVGLEVLSGRADAGPGIEVVAGLLDLDFIPLCWESFDLVVSKAVFFDKAVQRFLNLLHQNDFKNLVIGLPGYDMNMSGTMLFQNEQNSPAQQNTT
jgi:molybdate-binding protein